MRPWMLVLFSVLMACNDYPPPDPLDAELTACTADAECEVVELGCCDSCNGGTAVAVNVDKVAETEERYSERCGLSTTCTLVACAPWEAVCDAGTCALEQGSFE